MLTLPPTKKTSRGFTLIELLIATAILGGISVVGIQLLWDTLTTRSKQYSIEGSSDNLRLTMSTLTKAIQAAGSISIPNSSTIEITGTPCRTVRLASGGQAIEQAVDDSPSCTPPSSGFTSITKDEISIQRLEFSPIGPLPKAVTIEIEGVYQDDLGNHPIDFKTTVVPRVVI